MTDRDSQLGGGLLSAAELKKREVFFKEADSSFTDSVLAVPKTIDAPAPLFNRFIESFRVEKGALLLLDQDTTSLVHVASCGYDVTTIRRLRFPLHDYDLERPQVYRTSQVTQFRPYFSIREFSMLDRILLIPGRVKAALFALILITEGDDYLFTVPPSFPSHFLKGIEDSSFFFSDGEEHIHSHEEANGIVTALTEKHGSVSVALIECSQLLQFLKQRNENADPFALLHRGVAFTRGQLTESFPDSQVIELAEAHILVLMPSISQQRLGTVIHQATIALRSRFGPLHEVPQLPFSTAQLPDDGLSVRELFPEIDQK
ncbi:hypothetical protein [Sediminispirochaeta bajacaliforniensis]|uniref:hypothetical protein n=1 Tax=Sediminispirochaeta bajacaliforniensis TaxID=148 RepID=UPI000371E26E|nr:hypothetical protein [Sediminispirochaeta bajacaliforniensis]